MICVCVCVVQVLDAFCPDAFGLDAFYLDAFQFFDARNVISRFSNRFDRFTSTCRSPMHIISSRYRWSIEYGKCHEKPRMTNFRGVIYFNVWSETTKYSQNNCSSLRWFSNCVRSIWRCNKSTQRTQMTVVRAHTPRFGITCSVKTVEIRRGIAKEQRLPRNKPIKRQFECVSVQ